MNERIKALRSALGLNQTDFGAAIGVKQSTVTGYENGTRTPIDAVIASICREFNVSEAWLRTGEGEMFQPKSRNEEIIKFSTQVAAGDPSSIQAQLLSLLARLTDEQWEVLAQVAREFVEETKKAGPQ